MHLHAHAVDGHAALAHVLDHVVERVRLEVGAAWRPRLPAVGGTDGALVVDAVEYERRLRIGLVRPAERHVDVLGADHTHPDLLIALLETAEVVVHFVHDVPHPDAAAIPAHHGLNVLPHDVD